MRYQPKPANVDARLTIVRTELHSLWIPAISLSHYQAANGCLRYRVQMNLSSRFTLSIIRNVVHWTPPRLPLGIDIECLFRQNVPVTEICLWFSYASNSRFQQFAKMH